MQVQEAHRELQTRWMQRGPLQDTLKCQRLKIENLKAVREKHLVTYRGVPIRLSVISQKKLCRLDKIGKKYSKSLEKQGPTANIVLPSKAII